MAADPKELKKQIDAFKQIVTLRAAVESLSKELTDLKRRAIINVQKQQEAAAVEESKRDRNEIAKCNDIFETLDLAREKFAEFDANHSGYLDGDEMLILADWVWSVFSLDGSKIRQIDSIRAKNRLLTKFDANSDGKLDFEEFALWFLETWNALKKQGGISLDDGDKDDANEYIHPKPASRLRNIGGKPYSPQQSRLRNIGDPSYAKKSPMTTPSRSMKTSQTPQRPYASSTLQGNASTFNRNNSPMVPKRSTTPMYNTRTSPTPISQRSQFSSQKRTSPTPTSTKGGNKGELWRCLLKYREPARNCIQLFLRFDRSGTNTLSSTATRDILKRCGVKPIKMPTVQRAFVKKFGATGNEISLEKFVETLPPKANEKFLFLLVLDVLEELKVGRSTFE